MKKVLTPYLSENNFVSNIFSIDAELVNCFPLCSMSDYFAFLGSGRF